MTPRRTRHLLLAEDEAKDEEKDVAKDEEKDEAKDEEKDEARGRKPKSKAMCRIWEMR